MVQSILVVDDEPHIREVVTFALERAGLVTTTARNGAEALVALRRGKVDLIVLDIGMPEMDGLEVCRQVRKTSQIPILFLSARDEEVDRVVGLEIGGDDYVIKPFSPRELVARVHAILKRVAGGSATAAAFEHGRIKLDRQSHSVTAGGVPIELTVREFNLLAALIARPEIVFSRDQLMDIAYGPGIYVSERTIDSHIRNIRAKFAAAGHGRIITTVHGVGFRCSPVSQGGS